MQASRDMRHAWEANRLDTSTQREYTRYERASKNIKDFNGSSGRTQILPLRPKFQMARKGLPDPTKARKNTESAVGMRMAHGGVLHWLPFASARVSGTSRYGAKDVRRSLVRSS